MKGARDRIEWVKRVKHYLYPTKYPNGKSNAKHQTE